jgi:hypothetical protein
MEPSLLKMYDAVLPEIDRALGGAAPGAASGP